MKKSIHPFWRSIIAIVSISLIAFIPLSNKLGFYYNDWHPVLGRLTNTSLLSLFKVDRPVVGIIYQVTTFILGDNPFFWQLFSISLRITAAIVFLTIVWQLWPKQWKQTAIMAILFAIYPGFMQQPIALTFSNHLIGLTFGLTSISLTIFLITHQWKTKLQGILILFIALGLEMAYLVIYEYMIGLELVRWILIWYVLFPKTLRSVRLNIKRWFFSTYYYFIPLGLFLYYRLFLFKSARPTTDIDNLINAYSYQPFQMIGKIIVDSFHALINTGIFAWFIPIYKSVEFVNFTYLIIGGILGGGAIFVTWLCLKRSSKSDSRSDGETNNWALDSFILGLLFLIVTLLPIVLSNREVAFRNLLDRYTLQSSFGVSMIVVGITYRFVNEKGRTTFLYFLIFISVLFNFSNNVYWKNHWENQLRLYWQLVWRAPQLKPDTVGMALQPEGYLFREDEDFYAPVNLIYYPDEGSLYILSDVFNDQTIRNILFQETTYHSYRTVRYKRVFSQLLVISNTNPSTCVHIIDGQKPELIEGESPIIRLTAPFSQIDQIMTNYESQIPPTNPFGKEPEHDWCYFYQKANLARQKGDWMEVMSLFDEASINGYLPNDSSEWMPFIEAYAVTGQLEKASELIEKVRNNTTVWMNICQNYDGTKHELSDWEINLENVLCSQE